MGGLKKALALVVEARGGKHPDRTREHRGFITQNVAEDVAGENDVKGFGSTHELHGGIVHVHVFKRHIGKLFVVHGNHRVAPELARFKDVRFINACDLAAALAGRFKGDARNAFDLRHAVAHRVKGFRGTGELAVHRRAAAAGVPK